MADKTFHDMSLDEVFDLEAQRAVQARSIVKPTIWQPLVLINGVLVGVGTSVTAGQLASQAVSGNNACAPTR